MVLAAGQHFRRRDRGLADMIGKASSCSRVHGTCLLYLPWTSAVLSGFPRTEVGMAAISSGTVSAAESMSGSVAPPDRMLEKDLAGLDDRELLDIVRLSQPASGARQHASC